MGALIGANNRKIKRGNRDSRKKRKSYRSQIKSRGEKISFLRFCRAEFLDSIKMEVEGMTSLRVATGWIYFPYCNCRYLPMVGFLFA
jgi:hypothetical protein